MQTKSWNMWMSCDAVDQIMAVLTNRATRQVSADRQMQTTT